jgi:hypothetical protein
MIKIKWSRLAKIVKEIVGRDIEIVLTTGITNPVVIAATDNIGTIFLNGNQTKTPYSIIEAIAHETTHLVLPDIYEDTKAFQQKNNQLLELITNKYYKE